MTTRTPFPGPDVESLMQQYWSMWKPLLGEQPAAAPAFAGVPGIGQWQQVFDAWNAMGGLSSASSPSANEAMHRFGAAAQGWFGQMQQLASQFAGVDAAPRTIADAWRQSLGGNPFAAMLHPFGDVQASTRWFQQLAPMLAAIQRMTSDAAGMPTFGITREHQARWQRLMDAQAELQRRSTAYAQVMGEAANAAFNYFEKALEGHAAAGQELGSARALFDLWIDAAETAYAEIAGGHDFSDAFAGLVDAQMRVRAGIQTELEHVCRAVGIPTRSDVDSAYSKLTEARRELRSVRVRLETLEAALGGEDDLRARLDALESELAALRSRPRPPERHQDPEPEPEPTPRRAPSAARKAPARKKTAPAKRAAVRKQATAKKATAKKATAKKAAGRQRSAPAARQPAVPQDPANP